MEVIFYKHFPSPFRTLFSFEFLSNGIAYFRIFPTISAMKTSPRSHKLASIIGEQLPPMVEKFLTPNQVGFLTITAVEVSGDLGLVDVFINVMGANSQEALKSLAKVTPKIRFELLKKVKLRREFILRWKIDQGRMNMGKF